MISEVGAKVECNLNLPTYKIVSGDFLFNSGIDPVNHRLVVYPIPPKEKEGEIFIPETIRDREAMRQIKACVVAIGPRCDFENKITDGDLVLISKHAGYLFKGIDGREYRLVNDDDIVGIMSQDFDLHR